ncbi:hypothetical protein ACX1NA_03295 [Mycoplasma sp. VS276A1]
MKKIWKYTLLGTISVLPLCSLVSCQQLEKGEINDNLSKVNGIKEKLWANPDKNFNLDELNKAILKFVPAQNEKYYYLPVNYLKSLNLIIHTINRNPKIYNNDGTINKTAWININLVNNYLKYMNSDDCFFIKKENANSNKPELVPTQSFVWNSKQIPLYKKLDLSADDIKHFTSTEEAKKINFLQQILENQKKLDLSQYSKEHKELVLANRKYGLDSLESLSLIDLESKKEKAKMTPSWNVEEEIFNKLYPNYELNQSNALSTAWNNKIEFLAKVKDPEFNAPLSYLHNNQFVQAINEYTVQEVTYTNSELSTLLNDNKLSNHMHQALIALKDSVLSKNFETYFDKVNILKDYNEELEISKLEELNTNVRFYKISIPVNVEYGNLKPEIYMVDGLENKIFINYHPKKHQAYIKYDTHTTFDTFESNYKKIFSEQFDRYANKTSDAEKYINQVYDSLKTNKTSLDNSYVASNEPIKIYEFIIPLIVEGDNQAEFIINKVPSDFIKSLEYQTYSSFEPDLPENRDRYIGILTKNLDKNISNAYLNNRPYDLATLHNTQIPEIDKLLKGK